VKRLLLLLSLAAAACPAQTLVQICYSNASLSGTSITIPSSSFTQYYPNNGSSCADPTAGDTMVFTFENNLGSAPTIATSGQSLSRVGGSMTGGTGAYDVEVWCGTGAVANTAIAIATTSISNGSITYYEFSNALSCSADQQMGTYSSGLSSAYYSDSVPTFGVHTRVPNEVVFTAYRGNFANASSGISVSSGWTMPAYYSNASWAAASAYQILTSQSRVQNTWTGFSAGGLMASYIVSLEATSQTAPTNPYSQNVLFLDNATGGADTNGCIFNFAATGVNYAGPPVNGLGNANFPAPLFSINDSTITAYVQGSAIYAQSGEFPNTGDIGNYVQFTAGPQTTGTLYQITSIQVGYSSSLEQYLMEWGLNSSPGNGTVAGANIGGSCATLSQAVTFMGAANVNRTYVKASGTNYAPFTWSSSPANGAARFLGYCNAIDDNPGPGSGCQPVLQATTAVTGITATSGAHLYVGNFVLDGNSVGLMGVDGAEFFTVVNSEIKNWTEQAVSQTSPSNGPIHIDHDYIHNNCISSGQGAVNSIDFGGTVTNSWIDSNNCAGIALAAVASLSLIDNNVVSRNAGAGIQWGTSGSLAYQQIIHNTIYGNTGDGLQTGSPVNPFKGDIIKFNVIHSNGGYGIDSDNSFSPNPIPANIRVHQNAFYDNASGACTSNMLCASGLPYNDALLNCDPLVNASSLNFALNTGCGAALMGVPNPNPWIPTNDYFGAYMPAVAGIGSSVQ
jgi:Periplasmic copper-binding protein (NosD)